MCRNIRPLFNYEPPANNEEITKASKQFVRKISGFTKPSKVNEDVFNQTVEKISGVVQEMLQGLVTNATPKNREAEAEKLRKLNEKRFGKVKTSN